MNVINSRKSQGLHSHLLFAERIIQLSLDQSTSIFNECRSFHMFMDNDAFSAEMFERTLISPCMFDPEFFQASTLEESVKWCYYLAQKLFFYHIKLSGWLKMVAVASSKFQNVNPVYIPCLLAMHTSVMTYQRFTYAVFKGLGVMCGHLKSVTRIIPTSDPYFCHKDQL